MITILQVFACSSLFLFWSKSDYVVLLHQSLCLLVNTTSHHVYCSLLPLSPTLCLSQSAYINLSTIISSLFSSIAPGTLKAQTFPNITRNTSSFSSSSQATVNHRPLKSLPFYFTSFFSNLRSVRMKISACYIPNIFLKCLFQSPPSTQSAHRTHKVQN